MADVELIKTYKSKGKALTKELTEADRKWEKIVWEKSPEAIEEYNTNMHKGYFDAVSFLVPI